MSEVFDFGFAQVKVRIGPGGHSAQGSFDKAHFQNQQTKKKSEVRCFQYDAMTDVHKDVDKIKSGHIQGTQFYQNWMKVFFDHDQAVSFTDLEDVSHSGYYSHQDFYRKTNFYFKFGEETHLVKGWKVYLDDVSYLI